MTRAEYLANSSKLLMICSILLFSVNSLSFIGMYSDAFSSVTSKLTNICFYVVLILGFLAFNGEGIAYKHSRQRKYKKITVVLKAILLSAFLIRFVKTPVEGLALKVNHESVAGALTRLGLGAFNTVASYGFLLTVVALWLLLRDRGTKKLSIPQIFALSSGVIYNTYKVLDYSVTKYGFTYFGDIFNEAFSNPVVLNALCLVHFLADIIMFAAVLRHYDEKAVAERQEKTAITRKMVTSRKIYTTDCFGLDTLEDDFFLEKCDENPEI